MENRNSDAGNVEKYLKLKFNREVIIYHQSF
nr:MAG TPA: hypothetical protein [Caudoviricetes sp.]